MGTIRQFIKRRGLIILMLLLGVYFSGKAIWNLSNTLLFAHEAVIVQATVKDVRQRPFESAAEALSYGNFPWNGEVAYRPILTAVMPNGLRIPPFTAPDLDNTDYQRGEQVELITLPHNPNSARVNKWKFLWGADCMLLATGLLLGLPAWFILFPRKRRTATNRRPAPAKATAAPAKTPAPQASEPRATAASKTRAPRKKKEADPDAPKKPRAPRKKKEVNPNAPPKPRKPRKKKTAE